MLNIFSSPKVEVYRDIKNRQEKKKKSIALLIDPDRLSVDQLKTLIDEVNKAKVVRYIFFGSSILFNKNTAQFLSTIKDNCDIPVVLFPGHYFQIMPQADAILFLSLISGRNPELLIGQHVVAAPILQQQTIEVISTGYMLIGAENQTSVRYMSNSMPIPSNKDDIATATALAGEMLGMKLIYLEAGSGAIQPVPISIINKVKSNISLPIIVGGGINSFVQLANAFSAGADLVVMGNIFEKEPDFLSQIESLYDHFDLS